MQYTTTYQSPLGEILLAADEVGLIGLWFEGERFYASNLDSEHEERELSIFETVKKWLDIYFSGWEPDFMPAIHMTGSPFRLSVWKLLQQIPYGETVAYGELAEKIADKRGIAHMSAQAVGGAVAHNEISILVPCHRVVGSDGSLTGYAGGLQRKIKLLTIERADMAKLYVPTKGTAL